MNSHERNDLASCFDLYYYVKQQKGQGKSFEINRGRLIEDILQAGVGESCRIIAERFLQEGISITPAIALAQQELLRKKDLPLRVMVNNKEWVAEDPHNKRPFINLALETALNTYDDTMRFTRWNPQNSTSIAELEEIQRPVNNKTRVERTAFSIYTALITYGIHIPDIEEYRWWAEEGKRIYRENEEFMSGVKPPENPQIIPL